MLISKALDWLLQQSCDQLAINVEPALRTAADKISVTVTLRQQ